MSTLDDFFGDGRTAKKECLHCGKTGGELIVAISDAYGPTHWIHPACRVEMERIREQQAQSSRDAAARHEAMDEWEEPSK